MLATKRNKGFTLIETILASLILCASVLVLVVICTRSLSGTRLNRQYETASDLAEKRLVFVDYMGVENFINSGETQGEFEQLDSVYNWKISAEKIGIGNLYEVRATVTWVDQNRSYDVSASTRINGTGDVSEGAPL